MNQPNQDPQEQTQNATAIDKTTITKALAALTPDDAAEAVANWFATLPIEKHRELITAYNAHLAARDEIAYPTNW
ncbi:hypothetical protein [Corynebacterium pseudopelargi]|uniref:Uncharacterized protein n=1 Tax=Corynebacterium pseudopelargi TaxID=2080757 RepID=A0A3G6IV40_9CORY|nr:hypothetical protein [Corynebacterium pseudopelargi]AZA08498.1 hypothetical protein CPPEL_01760 [Corynebacterium pseudopelargi]